jgi:hypothetical protein
MTLLRARRIVYDFDRLDMAFRKAGKAMDIPPALRALVREARKVIEETELRGLDDDETETDREQRREESIRDARKRGSIE